jgi:hypothetical protein
MAPHLNWTLDGGKLSALHSDGFTPERERVRSPCNHYVGGWMGP